MFINPYLDKYSEQYILDIMDSLRNFFEMNFDNTILTLFADFKK